MTVALTDHSRTPGCDPARRHYPSSHRRCWPARATASSFVGRMRMVSASTYVNAIVILYMLTAILGGIIYPIYRVSVRFVLEQSQLYAANGSF